MTTTTYNARLRLLNILSEGNTAYSTFVALNGMRLAQVLSYTGLDALIIDCEHGYISDTDMHDMVSATASAHVSPVVRIRGASADLVKRALDTGAHGLLVPMIHTAEDARSIVSFSKFPPAGVRGQGAAFPCYEHGLATPRDYVATANKNILIMIQIESAEGLANVDEISRVEGIDMIFIGPNDLALALLGYAPAKGDEPRFLEAIDVIIKAARQNGKKTGILAPSGEAAHKLRDNFDFIAIGTDIRGMSTWFANELNLAKGEKN